MFRRLRTLGLPGVDAGERPWTYNWDFRLNQGVWSLEIPMSGRGSSTAAPHRPEQAAWLVERGFPQPDRRGRVSPLPPEERARLTALLDPLAERPWEAHELQEELKRRMARRQLEGARALADRLAELAPGWSEARERRLNLLIGHLRDKEAALADLEGLPPGTLDEDALRRHRQSLTLLDDDWAAYARYQRQALEAGHRRPGDYEILGLAWWGADDLERSLAAFDEGLEAHPGHLDLRCRRAEVLDVMGRSSEARAELEALINEHPDQAKPLALRGWMCREEAPERAREDYASALGRDPEQPVARVGRGLMRLEAGDAEGARADLEPFIYCGWTEAAAAWERFEEAFPDQPDHHHACEGEPT